MTGARGVALVGFMGAGKSTIGRALAARIAVPFVDLDDVLEAGFGPVGEQIVTHGEATFRRREAAALAALCDGTRRVLATGGGAFEDPTNRHLLSQHYTTVFLDASIDVLAARVGSDSRRPLWTDGAAELLALRRPAYELAEHRVDGTEDVASIVERVVVFLEGE